MLVTLVLLKMEIIPIICPFLHFSDFRKGVFHLYDCLGTGVLRGIALGER